MTTLRIISAVVAAALLAAPAMAKNLRPGSLGPLGAPPIPADNPMLVNFVKLEKVSIRV